MIIPIYKQPIRMAPFDEQDYACEPGAQYCSLYKTEDYMRVQMRQTPCGSDLMCNADFESGLELLTNGSFTGSATGWTLGTGWSYSSNTIVHAGATGNATQSMSGVASGKTYTVTITVSGLASSIDVNIGLGTSVNISTDGTHTIYVTAGGSNSLFYLTNLAPTWGATVDFVSCKELACWTFDADDTIINNGVACHTPGTASDLSEDIYSGLVSGDYVTVTYAIFAMSAGTVVVKVGGTTSRTVTQNGTYTDYVTTGMTDTLLVFEMDTDFDGCISPVESYKLLSVDELFDSGKLTLNGVIIDDLVVTLNEDRINYNYFTGFLEDDCYQFSVLDPCATVGNLVEINSDVPFNVPGDWTATAENAGAGDTCQITGGEMVCTNVDTAGGPYYFQALNDYVFPDGQTTFIVEVTVITGVMDSAFTGAELNLMYPNSNGSGLLPFLVEPDALGGQTYTATGNIVVDNGTAGTYHNKFGLRYLSTGIDTDVNRITSFSVKMVAVTDADTLLTSNCLQLRSDVENSLIVRGESDEDHSLGFVFDANFPYLETRLFTHFVNPRTPTEQNNYLYSNRRKKKTRASIEKIYDLQFEEVDENMHDVIPAILASDHCYLGVTVATFREYIWEEKSYEPLWPKKSATGVAESVVEIARINSTEFN